MIEFWSGLKSLLMRLWSAHLELEDEVMECYKDGCRGEWFCFSQQSGFEDKNMEHFSCRQRQTKKHAIGRQERERGQHEEMISKKVTDSP